MGTYNQITGSIKKTGSEIGTIDGRWSHVMEYQNKKSTDKRLMFDAKAESAQATPKQALPEEEQEPNESRRLWSKLTIAIKNSDMDAAGEAKSAVEDAQRESARKREEQKVKHIPRFFKLEKNRWVPKQTIPDDPEKAIKAVQMFMWGREVVKPKTAQ
jgi:hypothetical protein